MEWYPVKLSYHVRTYHFGDRLIPDRLGKAGAPDGIVAETWEVSDHRSARATITNGSLAGGLLNDAVRSNPDEIVGEGWSGDRFPMLAKFLDASHMLPVHLHADDTTAQRLHGEPNGKTEAWHILWCDAGSTILAGIKPGLRPDEIRTAFATEDYDAVMPRHPITPGDTVYVPGGVIHSFGPNTLIFEIQQTSDVSQSVMPTDLYGSRLSDADWSANIDAAMTELRTDYRPLPNAGLARTTVTGANRYVVGCAGPYFALERWTLSETYQEPSHPWRCLILSNVGSPVRLDYAGGSETLARAESCVIPAALENLTIVPTFGQPASLIVCYVPDMERDVVEPLRAAGHDDASIQSLGEFQFD